MTKGGARRMIPIAKVWLDTFDALELYNARIHPSGMFITGNRLSLGGVKVSMPVHRVTRIEWAEIHDPKRIEST